MATGKQLTARQLERRRRILRAAEALVGDKGYEGVTMRMIAEASGTAEKTLYNIFGTKDRLVAHAAHDRSAGVFALAAQREPERGWAQLRAFGLTVAEVTIEAPVLARAMAGLLVDHADLVGLHEVYEQNVGAILAEIVGQGLLDPDAPRDVLVRMIRLGVVSAVLFWAKGEIADAELAPYAVQRCAESLLAFATPAGAALFRQEIIAATEGLAGERLAGGEPHRA